jgi:hypothetical protein
MFQGRAPWSLKSQRSAELDPGKPEDVGGGLSLLQRGRNEKRQRSPQESGTLPLVTTRGRRQQTSHKGKKRSASAAWGRAASVPHWSTFLDGSGHQDLIWQMRGTAQVFVQPQIMIGVFPAAEVRAIWTLQAGI